MSERFKLTVDALERRCRCPGADEVSAKGKPVRQRIYWDTELAGFGVLASTRVRSFIVQKDIGGRSVRASIGRYPAWAPEQARKRARELLVEMDKGVDPNARARDDAARLRREQWQTFTLAQAVEEHVLRMRTKQCVEKSMEDVRDAVRRYMSDWRSRPLAGITRGECVARHRQVTADHGAVVANNSMRVLRAVYNSARKVHPELPSHPVEAVEFNVQRRKRSPVAWGDLPAWWRKVQGIENPIRRDLQLLMLFTGLRSADAKSVRWSDLNFEAGTIHRPRPKGGEDRAFTVPLCAFALTMLARRRLDNLRYFSSDQGWAFPTRDREGKVAHVAEAKEQRYVKGPDGKAVVVEGKLAKAEHLPSPHRLRDTFAIACREAGVGLFETKILMNHTLPSDDVTEGYQRPSGEHLRACVEKVAAFLLAKAKVDGEGRASRAVGA